MSCQSLRKGRGYMVGAAWLLLLTGMCVVSQANAGAGPTIAIDLDRSTAAVDATLQVTPTGGAITVMGAIVVTGTDTDEAGIYAIEVQAVNASNASAAAINCPADPRTVITAGDVTDGPPTTVVALCSANSFLRSSVFATPATVGSDGVASLYNFDLEFLCSDGEAINLTFTPTSQNAQIGVTVNNVARTIGANTSNRIPDSGATIQCGTVVDTPTPSPTPLATFTPAPPCEDSGYYILDSFGGRHAVGTDIVQIIGNLYYGRDVARDMERVALTLPPKGPSVSVNVDLAVLDTFGAVQFVVNPLAAPPQMFFFPEGTTPPCGNAVDVELTNDSTGFWVLTEGGGIFRAGTANPLGSLDPQLGNDAGNLCNMLPFDFGGATPRDGNLPDDDNARVRAVGFVVVQSGDPANPTGFVIIDSQGGHFIFDGSGNALDDGDAGLSILSAATVYPFFPGLDIARDIELHPTGTARAGVIIYDGWGGTHPVPVEFLATNEVDFIRNELPAQVTTVGLPYITAGFDDPTTSPDNEGDPATFGIDANSIFRDLEFCRSTGGDGIYVLDAFGAVFTFGNTRAAPDNVSPNFSGGPYFFPQLYARDLEPFTELAETDMETEFETKFASLDPFGL